MIPNAEIVPQIVSEVVSFEHEIVAISVTMVMKDGRVESRNGFTEGQKLPLLAGTVLTHSNLVSLIQSDPQNFFKKRS